MVLGGAAGASELPTPFVLDLPWASNLTAPSWLGTPELAATQFAALDLPILTPDAQASLLVTFYFQEKEGGFMRIVWNGTQGAQTLSENFYEGIGMANQRSLLISPSTLIGDGTLTVQCGDATLGISRIKFEWLESQEGLVSPAITDLLVTSGLRTTQGGQTLTGQVVAASPGKWQGQIVTMPITDQPLRVEEGVDFSVQLDSVPVTARLALKEAGLPLGKRLVVWINEQRAGTITPQVPDLLDAGFMPGQDASVNYLGWRDGSFYVPVSLLKAGVNTLQLSDEADAAAESGSTTAASSAETSVPLALKDMVMQFDYAMTSPESSTVAAEPSGNPQATSVVPGPMNPSASNGSADSAPGGNASGTGDTATTSPQPHLSSPSALTASASMTTSDWTSPGAISAQATSTSPPSP